jgi:4-amino-4-deoxychorismate lyase
MNLSLIETMRFEPGQGIIRFRLHLARLGNSARKLGIPGFETAETALHQKLETLPGPSRVRLELFSDGHAEITSAMYLPMPDDTVWTVRIANSVELKSSEPLLRHKTSARAIYDTARAEYPRAHCDEVVLLNDKGDVSEGTITNVFVEANDGKLITPPLSSGCLAGVFRTSLLCRKKARVGRVLPADLEERPFYLGNSLRGLIRARLITDR